ncbi:Tyrosine specific protein phosphatases domain [Sesbania bispinosa]|nr:Tyrosine specific protein phosphatases domain [Sesbania bispinosa]
MLGEEGKEKEKEKKPSVEGVTRRIYSRSVSWTDRSPNTRKPPPPPPPGNSKPPRSLLPPLQPLSISKRSVEEWPSAGSDDLGVWPLPQTPRGSIRAYEPNKDFQFKRDKLAFFDKECSRIAEHIYLGSDTVAKNHQLLRRNGITHVLNCVGFVCPEYFKSDFVYKTLWLQDSPTEDITSILYDVFDYFEDVREQGGRVLVHCCQGVSRSTTLVIAYLMWREGQSFEDAFQFVKTARAVTNPNMGFACQLLQCQKRVHAMPASPNSILRMYRMAPHSPYDPLHLVPKMVNQPGVQALDSRGAFIIHIPSAIYVWIGKHCNSVMSCNARSAAFQVIRYERAKGPILSIHEDEEPPGFWGALADNSDKAGVKEEPPVLNSESMEIADAVNMGIGPRKVDAYDLDFEIFHKALAGGVVPPFSVSNAESETCLPAREHGWARLRRKFASGVMKELLASPKWNCDATSSNDKCSVIVEEKNQDSVADPLSPSSNHPCGSPDSFECSPNDSLGRAKDTVEAMDFSVPGVASILPLSPPGTSNPFPCFLSSSPKFNPKSPTLSPSSSDYASSFTFSPSSTNWSDLSFVSSRQPSPSGLESTEPFYDKDVSFSGSSSLLHKEDVSSPSESFLANHTLGGANSNLPLKGSFLSIAERRGNPPPRMLLSSINESSHVHKNLVRSQSFSLPDLDDNMMKDDGCKQSDHENYGKWLVSDDGIISSGVESQGEINDIEEHGTMLCNMMAELEVEEKVN